MKKNKKAIVLPCVLWSLLIVSVLYSAFHNRIKNNIILIKALKYKFETTKAVNNTINLSMAILYNNKKAVTSFQDNHIDSDVFLNNDLINYSIKYEVEQINNEKSIVINGLYPLNSKLNINYIPLNIKKHLMENSVFDEEKWSALFDWIDEDNDPYNNGSGFETDYYENLNEPYKSKNNIIKTWNELYLIKDMNDDFINYLKNNFTIYDNGKININTVTFKTLQLLGYNDSLSEKFIQYLSGPDLIRGTNDDTVINDLSVLPSLLSTEFYFSAYEIAEILQHINMFSVTSNFYKVNIFNKDKKITEAIISKNEENTIIVENVIYCD